MLLAVLAAALSAAALGYVVASLFVRPSEISRTLADLDFAGIEAQRHEHLGVFARFVDEGGRTRLERRLIQAGRRDVSPRAFLTRCVLYCATGFVGGIALWLVAHRNPLLLLMALLMTACGAIVPNLMLDGAITERKRQVRNALPDLLDLVSTTVEAGIALNGALASAIDGVRGPLRDELLTVLADIRVGRSRAEALTAMAARCDVVELTTAVTAIVQAEKLGGDIANILDQLAHEGREHRMTRAEEIAAELPVKMTFPMALCMLPALFVMIFGAVAAEMLSQ